MFLFGVFCRTFLEEKCVLMYSSWSVNELCYAIIFY